MAAGIGRVPVFLGGGQKPAIHTRRAGDAVRPKMENRCSLISGNVTDKTLAWR